MDEATHAQLAEIISLKDYMAMAALPVFIEQTITAKVFNEALVAKMAYQMADAMLAARQSQLKLD